MPLKIIGKRHSHFNPLLEQQLKVLKTLLQKARFTEFGQYYFFDSILNEDNNNIIKRFQNEVPIFDYDKIYTQWWYKNLEGKMDICWPGKIKYYALSSGTSGAPSKYIPITNDILKSNFKVMVRQLLSLRKYQNVPKLSAMRGWLSLGGSTQLQKIGDYYAGDLSGISAKKRPFWFEPFYKPSKKISKQTDWNQKIKDIADRAKNWDIGFILGVPAWTIMLFDLLKKKYNINTIHEIWPNFDFYVHGGVFFEPYKRNFETYLGKPISYIETYLSSEGFLAYQEKQNFNGMKLVINEHLFFEFIPFNNQNFNEDGSLINTNNIKTIDECQENTDYALLISTNAGAWRYLIGDIIKFINLKETEIIITGRTKQFLSVVGEHLSIDNLNQAIAAASQHFSTSLTEFTINAKEICPHFAHQWYLAHSEKIKALDFLEFIDNFLKKNNDDYGIERKSNLKNIELFLFKEEIFLNFLKEHQKIGSQQKFPRVLKGKNLENWQKFISNQPFVDKAIIL